MDATHCMWASGLPISTKGYGMRQFRLVGKTLKGKNRVRELGEMWLLDKAVDSVGFSTEAGSWLFVFPLTCRTNCRSTLCNHTRWVHLTNDFDFIVQEAGESDESGTKCLVERVCK